MKKTMWILVCVIVLIFIIQALRNPNQTTEMGVSAEKTVPDSRSKGWLIDTGEVVKNPMEWLKKALVADANFSYFIESNPDYVVRDEAFLEKVIQEGLDRSNNGKMPSRSNGLQQALHEARMAYSSALKTDEGISLVEKTIERRFTNPKLSLQNPNYPVLTVDYGVFSGKLRYQSGRNGPYAYKENPHFADQINEKDASGNYKWKKSLWKSEEVAAELEKWRGRFPEVKIFRLKANLIRGRKFLYEYRPAVSQFSYQDFTSPEYSVHSVSTYEINSDLTVYTSGKQSLYQLPDWVSKPDPTVRPTDAAKMYEKLLRRISDFELR